MDTQRICSWRQSEICHEEHKAKTAYNKKKAPPKPFIKISNKCPFVRSYGKSTQTKKNSMPTEKRKIAPKGQRLATITQ